MLVEKAADAVRHVQSGQRGLVHGSAVTPTSLVDALLDRAGEISDVELVRATRVVPVALDAEMAVNAASLHAMHCDPFDRLIVATALRAKARLVTADATVLASGAKAFRAREGRKGDDGTCVPAPACAARSR